MLPRNLITVLFTKSDVRRQFEDESFFVITKTREALLHVGIN